MTFGPRPYSLVLVSACVAPGEEDAMVKIKRVYDPAVPSDGKRYILITYGQGD